jgi:L-ascorbate metabolism protein UlaG (beta-lactamase superfamily)
MILIMVVASGLALMAVKKVLRLPVFGALPKGKHKQKVQSSPHFSKGQFQNLMPTPAFTEGYNMAKVMREWLFDREPQRKPTQALPYEKTDLHALKREDEVLVWFGHSSYYFQLNGLRFLVDPVLSGSASPFAKGIPAFEGSDVYKAEDIPSIDVLLVTHDHYDHLDYPTIRALLPKINRVYCGLGVGAHLQRWGVSAEQLHELDWHQQLKINNDITLSAVPTRHFSGRSLKRNSTLWLGFVVETPGYKLLVGGDSGYGEHFKQIGAQHGPFDLVLLENGQYDRKWKYIHMQPEEVLQAAQDLRAKRLLPVHSAKFALANHPWDEPLRRIQSAAGNFSLQLATPQIGERLELQNPTQSFQKWWEKRT